jgi:hypothetical protein
MKIRQSNLVKTEAKSQNGYDEYETVKRTTFIPLGIFLFIVAIWVIIKVCQVYIPAPDDTKSAINALLGFLTLSVIVVQSVIIKMQWQAMTNQHQTFLASERAYVAIKRPRLINKPFEVGQVPRIGFMVVNGGKTPAFTVSCANGTMTTSKSFGDVRQEMVDRSKNPIKAAYILGNDYIHAEVVPAVTFDTADLILAWQHGDYHYYWLSQVSYSDIGDVRETIRFWFEYVPDPKMWGFWTMREAEIVSKRGNSKQPQD